MSPQTNFTKGCVAYVTLIKPDKTKALTAAIRSLPAIDGLENLQFHHIKIGADTILLATYDGAVENWNTSTAKTLSPYLCPHPRLKKDSPTPWLSCETVC